MNVLAIIPARAGSKGIRDKNLRKIAGRSLVMRAVDAARHSNVVSDIFVTTNDDAVIEKCRRHGLDMSYKRPDHLASDTSGMAEVVIDVIDYIKAQGNPEPDAFVLLQPTSPFRTGEDIDACVQILRDEKCDTVISVHEVLEHPRDFICVDEDGKSWHTLIPHEPGTTRRQDYTGRYAFLNGAIYAVRTDFFRREGVFWQEGKSGLYYMNPLHGIDIDESADLLLAEALVQHPEFLDRSYKKEAQE